MRLETRDRSLASDLVRRLRAEGLSYRATRTGGAYIVEWEEDPEQSGLDEPAQALSAASLVTFEQVRDALVSAGGVTSRAAAALGCSPDTVERAYRRWPELVALKAVRAKRQPEPKPKRRRNKPTRRFDDCALLDGREVKILEAHLTGTSSMPRGWRYRVKARDDRTTWVREEMLREA